MFAQVQPRPAARLSAANMALKLGDASGAIQSYLDLLREGAVPADHDMLHRKLKEATTVLANRSPDPSPDRPTSQLDRTRADRKQPDRTQADRMSLDRTPSMTAGRVYSSEL